MKERAEKWLNSDIRADVRKMSEWLKKRKVAIMTTFGWSVAIALVIIVHYMLVYMEHPEVSGETVVIYTAVEKWSPRILPLGYLIILGASLMAGALLVDFGNVLFGWITSFFLSSFIALVGAFIFVWFVLGVGQSPVLSAFGGLAIEVVLQLVFMNVFRMVFPIIPIACLLTSFVGALIRAQIHPTAGG